VSVWVGDLIELIQGVQPHPVPTTSSSLGIVSRFANFPASEE